MTLIIVAVRTSGSLQPDFPRRAWELVRNTFRHHFLSIQGKRPIGMGRQVQNDRSNDV
jgi:hypothetical protein